LSIAQRIISLHAADIAFGRSSLGGLKVSLSLDLVEPTAINAIEGSALPANMM
jgi:hypothetical protein